jgi:hypothetical protein
VLRAHKFFDASDKSFHSSDFRARQTSFIASRGIVICSTSLLVVVLLAVIQVAFEMESLGQHWMRTLIHTVISIMCILWMDLKIKVDKMASMGTQIPVDTIATNHSHHNAVQT